jgi:hypothetical protein
MAQAARTIGLQPGGNVRNASLGITSSMNQANGNAGTPYRGVPTQEWLDKGGRTEGQDRQADHRAGGGEYEVAGLLSKRLVDVVESDLV